MLDPAKRSDFFFFSNNSNQSLTRKRRMTLIKCKIHFNPPPPRSRPVPRTNKTTLLLRNASFEVFFPVISITGIRRGPLTPRRVSLSPLSWTVWINFTSLFSRSPFPFDPRFSSNIHWDCENASHSRVQFN